MKNKFLILALLIAGFFPALSQAKGMPLFFNTGDEIFEVNKAPDLGDGFKLGYTCKHFGLFGADVWSWGCELAAVNKEEFSAAYLDFESQQKYEKQYSLSDRNRNFWNHYGILILLLVVGLFFIFSLKNAN